MNQMIIMVDRPLFATECENNNIEAIKFLLLNVKIIIWKQ
jgi:hypothetical protein